MDQTGKKRGDVSTLIALLKVATLIHRPMRDGVATPLGLSANELRILMALGGEGALAGYELSDLIGLPPMNVSRAFDSLLAMGLVEQVPDTRNRRRKPHQLSTAGWEVFHATEARIGSLADFLFEGLTERDRTNFADLLEAIDRRIAEWQPPVEAEAATG